MNWYAQSLVPAASTSLFSLLANKPVVAVLPAEDGKCAKKRKKPKQPAKGRFPMANLLEGGQMPAICALLDETKANELELDQRDDAEQMIRSLHVNFFEPLGAGINAKVYRLNKRKMKNEANNTVLRRVTAVSAPNSNEMGLRDPLFLDEFKDTRFVPGLIGSFAYAMTDNEITSYQAELKAKHEARQKRKNEQLQASRRPEEAKKEETKTSPAPAPAPARQKKIQDARVYIRQDIFMERLQPFRLVEKEHDFEEKRVKYFTVEKSVLDLIVRCVYWLSENGVIHGDLKFDQFLLKVKRKVQSEEEEVQEEYDDMSLSTNDDDNEKEEEEEKEDVEVETVKISDFGFSGGVLPDSNLTVYPIEGWTVIHKYTKPVSDKPICSHTKERIFMPLEQATRADVLYYNLWQLTWSWLVLTHPLIITMDGQEEYVFAGFSPNIEHFSHTPTAFCRDAKQDYRTDQDRERIRQRMMSQYKALTTVESWMEDINVEGQYQYGHETVQKLISQK